MRSLSEPSVSPSSGSRPGVLGQRVRMPGGLELSLGQMALVTGIAFYSLAIPGSFDYKLDAMGFAVCHQIHTHSFTIAGHQMPLCARCTGIYLGALATLLLLMKLRGRAARLPAGQTVGILAILFGVMVLDGINSTLETFGSGMWESTNLVRLITGGLAGVSVAFILYPVFNLSLWHRDVARRERSLEQPFELLGYLVPVGLLVALVLDGGDWLYYPLSVLSIGGMLAMLTVASTMLVMMVTRREGVARSFSEALTPVLLGVCLGLVMLTLAAWGRASLAPYLVNEIGMPLVPGLP